MRKRIAVFACAISFDNQSRIMRGILDRAKERDIDVYIFTCHVNYMETEANKSGAFKIMELADIRQFDGVILLKNSIQYEPAAEDLVKRIRDSGVAAVSIDEKIPGMKYVGISSYSGMKEIVDHMICHHHYERICYVSGILGNKEGDERLQAYKDSMEEHGKKMDPSCFYQGNYGRDSGRAAARYFLGVQGNMPDAVVFANDAMAIGGIEELAEQGYRVPEDVAVSGFDDDRLSRFYQPSLTTINRQQEVVGAKALDMLFFQDMQEETLQTETICRHSCGCLPKDEISLDRLRRDYSVKNLLVQQAVDAIKNMSLELSGLEDLGIFCKKLRPYVQCSDMDSFCLCLCEEHALFSMGDSLEDTLEHYTEKVTIPLAYSGGEFFQYGSFPSAHVLPQELRTKDTCTYYIVSPVYYQNVCFGYSVSEGSEFALNSELAYSWTVNLGIALENIRKWLMMQQMMEKMGNMWKYDMLTGVYNRSGFFYYAKNVLKKIKEEDSRGFILFLDLDGLKAINDEQGHEQGDRCIREMAVVLQQVIPRKDLVMRYGGDEFVVFGTCETTDYVEELIREIRQEIRCRNEEVDRDFELSVSMGCSHHSYQEIRNLGSLIEQADKRMYEEKKRKRRMKENKKDN